MSRKFEDHCWADVIDDETMEIHQAYARDVYVGPRPAVLMVDVYKESYEGGTNPVKEVVKLYPSSCGETMSPHCASKFLYIHVNTICEFDLS